MACPNGYIEVNGDCVYAFGNESGVGPDGTPLPPKKGGGFWDWVKNNLPDILVAAGSVWQSSRQHNQPVPSTSDPSQMPESAKTPIWVWVLLALAVIVILFLLLRPRAAQVVQVPARAMV